MNKKLFYAILICIIVAGAITIVAVGLKADMFYSKNLRIDVYLGKEYNRNDVEQIAKEVFGTNKIMIQQVEYYGDMFSLTIPQDVEDIDTKVEDLNNKINEKYELENKKEDIKINYQPKIKLSGVLIPYLAPLAISMAITLIYAIIRFRKVGILKTVCLYILAILVSEAVYLSILAITRIPINRLVTPIGLAIYAIVITVVTAMQEKKLLAYTESENSKKKQK